MTTNCSKTSLPSSGMLLYYHNHHSQVATSAAGHHGVQLSNYKYQTIGGVCKDLVAFKIATNHTIFSVSVRIVNTKSNQLNNTTVLKYHDESCGAVVNCFLYFINCRHQ